MKAARLVSEIIILGARSRPITAAELSSRLEVTERTIYRDIGELSGMGVPVVTEPGAGGGISLLGDWVSPMTGMTRDELDSVLIGSLAATDLGMSSELAAARAKILTETDSGFSRHILVDGPDWFMAKDSPDQLSTIVAALRSHRGLRIDYLSRSGARTRALIPLGLVIKAGRWYLVAQPPGGRPRTYRVSRIASAELRFRRVSRPSAFDLGEYWTISQAEFDRSIRTEAVRLRLPTEQLGALLHAVPGRATEEAVAAGVDAAGLSELELPMEPGGIALAQLISVPGVEVLSPESLRRELCSWAKSAVQRNHCTS